MKRIVLLFIILSTGSPSVETHAVNLSPIGSGEGHWDSHSVVTECGPSGVCAEWYEEDSTRSGTVCCIDGAEMSSRSFSACIRVIHGPRSSGDMI